MAASTKTPFPLNDIPFLDPQGRVQRVWLDFLVSLFRRTGAEGGGDLTALTALVKSHTAELAEHEGRLDALDGEVADLRLIVETNPFGAALAAVLGRMATLELMVAGLPAVSPTVQSTATLPEPVAVPRVPSDDLRKLIEA
jgi:hypothetical protein